MNVAAALTLSVHLAGLSLWLGGIVFFLLVVRPAVNDADASAAIRTIDKARVSFEAMSWSGIVLLLASGIAALSWREHLTPIYWPLMTIKLLLFLAMAVIHGLQVFRNGRRIAALTAEPQRMAESWPPALRAEWEKWFTLLKINAALGPIVAVLGLMLMRQ